MFFLFILLTLAPPMIALKCSCFITNRTPIVKEQLLATVQDFLIMAFIINMMTYFAIYINQPNEVVYFSLFKESRLYDAGFVFKFSAISFVSALVVGPIFGIISKYASTFRVLLKEELEKEKTRPVEEKESNVGIQQTILR